MTDPSSTQPHTLCRQCDKPIHIDPHTHTWRAGEAAGDFDLLCSAQYTNLTRNCISLCHTPGTGFVQDEMMTGDDIRSAKEASR